VGASKLSGSGKTGKPAAQERAYLSYLAYFAFFSGRRDQAGLVRPFNFPRDCIADRSSN
jgi:hypothetical protein